MNDALNKIITDNGPIDYDMPYCIFYTGTDKSRAILYRDSNPTLFREEDNVSVHCLGSTIGTHVGPNVLGLAFFKKV